MTARNMNPKGGLFRLFQTERSRLWKETESGVLESIFYSNKHNSIQYKVNDSENGTLTVLFTEQSNDFWWQKQLEEGMTKKKRSGLGKHLGLIESYAGKDYMNVVFLREENMNHVPPFVSRLVNDYHTRRERLGFAADKTDHFCVENLYDEPEMETQKSHTEIEY